MAVRCDFCDFAPGSLKLPNDPRKIPWDPAEIVVGHHHARGRKRASQFRRRHVLRSFNFDVAPAAACSPSLRQNLHLRFAAASEQTPTLAAAAGGDKRRSWPVATQPFQECGPLTGITEIVETQLKSSRRPEPETR